MVMNCKGAFFLFLPLVLIMLSLCGCSQPETIHYDQEGFLAVSVYVDEIIPAVESAKFDLDEWARDIPDPEPLGWLKVDAEIIKDINQRHLAGDFPSYEEMEGWTVPVKRNGQKWEIEGSQMAVAVQEIIERSGLIVEKVSQLVGEEDIQEEDFLSLAEVINGAVDVNKKLRYLFYNEAP